MIKWLIGITLITFLVIVVFIAARQNSNVTLSKITDTENPTKTQELIVEGNEFSFSPSTMIIKKGQPVKITFKNTGSFPHDLAIPQLNTATTTIQNGQETSVEFTPQTTGTFNYLCTVGTHAEKGMQGTLIVE
jgi:plastocyanin